MSQSIFRLPTKTELKEFVKNEPRYLLMDAIGSFIYAIGIYTFASQASFAPGGVTGIALLINHFFPQLLIGSLTVLCNIPIVLVSFRYLGSIYLIRTFQTLIMNAVFLDYVAPLIPAYQGHSLLAAIFSGALSGLGLAVVYHAGTCTGGSDLIIMSVRKTHPHLSIGQITMFTDGAIIIAGAFVYKDVDAILYGILFTAISTMVIDKYMAGTTSGKVSLIISEHPQDIYAAIDKEIGRGATFLHGEGAHTHQDRKVLLCASSKKELIEIRRIAREIDPDALIIVMDYADARGEGFLPNKED